ncbi:MAG TPA: SAF domain-containing protein [Streptosporangiaceae bacterium]|nr:SAF domain-containing protein [Streptosporangiaceae bacterium]
MSGNSQTGSLGTVFHPEPELEVTGGRLPPPAQLRRLPRRRRPAMVALAAALIGAGVLGSAALYARQNHQVPVLLVIAQVPVGSVITSADIGTTTVVAGPGVQVIPARQMQEVVGLVAATSLRPGTLLAASELTTSAPPAAGQVLVPVAVHPSVLPAEGLVPGDEVLVVATPAAAGSNAAGGAGSAPILTKPVAATVHLVSAGPNSDGLVVVDLLVSYPNGIPIAQQAATGQIALILLHRSG